MAADGVIVVVAAVKIGAATEADAGMEPMAQEGIGNSDEGHCRWCNGTLALD